MYHIYFCTAEAKAIYMLCTKLFVQNVYYKIW